MDQDIELELANTSTVKALIDESSRHRRLGLPFRNRELDRVGFSRGSNVIIMNCPPTIDGQRGRLPPNSRELPERAASFDDSMEWWSNSHARSLQESICSCDPHDATRSIIHGRSPSLKAVEHDKVQSNNLDQMRVIGVAMIERQRSHDYMDDSVPRREDVELDHFLRNDTDRGVDGASKVKSFHRLDSVEGSPSIRRSLRSPVDRNSTKVVAQPAAPTRKNPPRYLEATRKNSPNQRKRDMVHEKKRTPWVLVFSRKEVASGNKNGLDDRNGPLMETKRSKSVTRARSVRKTLSPGRVQSNDIQNINKIFGRIRRRPRTRAPDDHELECSNSTARMLEKASQQKPEKGTERVRYSPQAVATSIKPTASRDVSISATGDCKRQIDVVVDEQASSSGKDDALIDRSFLAHTRHLVPALLEPYDETGSMPPQVPDVTKDVIRNLDENTIPDHSRRQETDMIPTDWFGQTDVFEKIVELFVYKKHGLTLPSSWFDSLPQLMDSTTGDLSKPTMGSENKRGFTQNCNLASAEKRWTLVSSAPVITAQRKSGVHEQSQTEDRLEKSNIMRFLLSQMDSQVLEVMGLMGESAVSESRRDQIPIESGRVRGSQADMKSQPAHLFDNIQPFASSIWFHMDQQLTQAAESVENAVVSSIGDLSDPQGNSVAVGTGLESSTTLLDTIFPRLDSFYCTLIDAAKINLQNKGVINPKQKELPSGEKSNEGTSASDSLKTSTTIRARSYAQSSVHPTDDTADSPQTNERGAQRGMLGAGKNRMAGDFPEPNAKGRCNSDFPECSITDSSGDCVQVPLKVCVSEEDGRSCSVSNMGTQEESAFDVAAFNKDLQELYESAIAATERSSSDTSELVSENGELIRHLVALVEKSKASQEARDHASKMLSHFSVKYPNLYRLVVAKLGERALQKEGIPVVLAPEKLVGSKAFSYVLAIALKDVISTITNVPEAASCADNWVSPKPQETISPSPENDHYIDFLDVAI